MLHPEAKERDNLLNILFNLIKKPDDEQRYVGYYSQIAYRERSGSVVDSLTPDRGAVVSSLTGVTALCP